MKKIVWLLMMVVMPMVANAAFSRNADLEDEDELLHRLDQYIARRDEFSSKKEKKLIRMKKKLNLTSSKRERLSLYNQIYREYYTYRYDSAMVYAKRGLQLAEQLHDDYYINLNKINRAAVLSLKPENISPKLMQYYYYTLTWVYNYWGAFCERSEFKEEMQDKKRLYLAKTLEHMGNKQSALYYYLSGELEYLLHRTDKKVLGWYQKALAASPVDSRVHASAAYCIARYYQDNEQMDIYEKYLVQAAISDQVCPLKENLALQELSTYLYNKDAKYAKRVSKYIYCSMEDAQFYNNRLRMVEISRILPLITETNHQREIRQNRIITISLVVVSIVSLGFLAMMFFVFRINKRLAKSRREVRSQNMLLEELNQKMLNTNKRRETYMRLFMDISAIYIKKLDDYRKLVSRKIKAKQTADLLTAINSYKLAEEEASSFYIRFDKAFMDLYPNFVDEFNQLLLPEKQIVLPAPNSLTKELRIYALMRLGITDGQELATLLFYSTQTIYNYKTSIRKRAKDLTTFDAAINQLCNVIG